MKMALLHTISDTAIDRVAGQLQTLSQEIWTNPELSNEEIFAHERLTKFLRAQGFEVECQYKGIQTAFRARFGSGSSKPHVVIFCEYDALPQIGHGCGHNLIAEVGVAAGMGVKAAMEAVGKDIGQVTVLGSPDEEDRGGKIRLISAGALEGVDVALMSHPTGVESPRWKTLATASMTIRYKGRASHASAFPWEGVNALDAAVLCYQNLSCLRQQLKPQWQIHGVIANGGTKPNIIPEVTELEYYIRAPSAKDLLELRKKVVACMEAAAQATGCSLEVIDRDAPPNLNVIQNEALIKTYLKHLSELDPKVTEAPEPIIGGSTDMGNVSYVVPAIHPAFSIAPGLIIHTREFTAAAGNISAQQRTLLEGKALARVTLDIFQNTELLAKTKAEFIKDLEINGTESVDELLAIYKV